MPIDDDQIATWKRAYQVLDSPLSASASSIKDAYRKLIKRRHPDLYLSGTPEQTEATQMTKVINEAYLAIKNAPLRYYVEAFSDDYVKSRQVTRPSPGGQSGVREEKISKMDWLEFWVRFVCGAVFGAFFGFREMLMYYSLQPSSFVKGIVTLTLVFGFGAALIGDQFWHSVRRRWWRWW
jgi:DnaJ-class molecular chaperone